MRSLAIETSRSTYTVTLTDGDRRSTDRTSRFDEDFDGIAGLVRRVLHSQGRTAADLDALAVNAGPGNLTSVRAGLSYANGLSFAAGTPLHFTNTLQILAFSARERTGGDLPTLAAHPARGAHSSVAYVGLFLPDGDPRVGFGPMEDLVPRLAAGLPELVTAGAARDRVPALAPGTRVHDSGLDAATSEGLAAMLLAAGVGLLVLRSSTDLEELRTG